MKVNISELSSSLKKCLYILDFFIRPLPELFSVLGPLERRSDAYTWRGPAMKLKGWILDYTEQNKLCSLKKFILTP